MSTKTMARTKRTEVMWDEHKYDEHSAALSRVYNPMLKKRLRSSKANIVFRIVPDSDHEPPARYLPLLAECEVMEKYVKHVSPAEIGQPEWITAKVENARLHGLILHEIFGHHGFSNIDLPVLFKDWGRRHADTLILLEEGRCEKNAYDLLDETGRASMRITVLDIILQDVTDENIDAAASGDEARKRLVLKLMGLVALRAQVGIIDPESARAKGILDRLEAAFGEEMFREFMLIARETGHIRLEYSTKDYERYHELVDRWIALEDEFLSGDDSGGGKEPGGEPGDDPGENPGDDPGGAPDPGGSSPDDKSKDGEENGQPGDSKNDSTDDGVPNGDDTSSTFGDDGDESGDESGDSKPDRSDDGLTEISDTLEGAKHMGEYSSSKRVKGDDDESLEDMLRDLRKELGAAADEADAEVGKQLAQQHGKLLKAQQEDEQTRRVRKADARKSWQGKERTHGTY